MTQTIVIIGGGQAGAAAVAALRPAGFEGRAILIGAERHLPYERPSLSKEMLYKPDSAHLTIFPESFYAENRVETRFGAVVAAIDAAAHTLTLTTGETIAYDKLLLATGARARRYPLLDSLDGGVYKIRTVDDSESLRGHIWRNRRILVVGGGVIGLEVAASMRSMGAEVTVIERDAKLMGRSAPAPLGEDLLALHQRHGVQFVFNTTLTEAARAPLSGEITLTASDGRKFVGDLVVYGVGVELNIELAVDAGLKVEDGIITDEYCRTSHPDIYAVGDVARQWRPHLGKHVREETWQNAQTQAAGAIRAMVSNQVCDFETSWWWSDQFGVNIQVAGAVQADEWVCRGDRAEHRCTLFGLTNGIVTGAVTLNNGKDMRPAKNLIAAQVEIDPARLADPAVALRTLVPKAA